VASPVPNLANIIAPLSAAIKSMAAAISSAIPPVVSATKALGSSYSGAAIATNTFSAAIADLGNSIGIALSRLVPSIDAFKAFGSSVSLAMSSLKEATISATYLLGAMLEPLKPRIQAAAIAITESFLGVAKSLKSGIDSVAMYVGGKLTDLFKPLAPAIDWLRDQSGAMFQKLRDYLGPVAAAAAEFGGKLATVPVRLTTALVGAVSATSQLTGAISSMLEGIATAGANALRQPFRVLDTLIASVGQGITRFVALYDPGRVEVFQYAVDSLYAALGKALAPAMDAVTQIVKALGSAIAGAGENGQKMIAAIAAGAVGLITFAAAMALVQTVTSGGILPILGALIGAFGGLEAVTGGLQPILDQLAPTLSGVMDVVGTALASASSAVGAILPTIAKAIEWAASVVGMLAGAFDALAPAIGSIMEVFNALMEAIRPVAELIVSALVGGVQLIGQAIQAIAPYLIIFYETMGTLWKQVVGWIKELLAMIGIALPEFAAGGPQKGNTAQTPAPVRSTSTGDVESVLRKARESAFSLGGGGQKPEVTTATNTGQTTQAVNDVRKQMNDMANWLMNALPHYIVSELPAKVYQNMVEVANRIKNVAKDVGEKSVEVPGTGGARVSVADVVGGPASGIGAYNTAADFIQNMGGPGLPRVRF
jgi:phage-related protein